MFHYTSCGLKNIFLRNGFTVKETKYGKAIAIHNTEGLHKVIGMDVISRKTLLCGDEIRFLRKELDFSQAVLARLLGVSESTIRGWENDRNPITKAADAVLRSIYRETIQGDGRLRDLVESISQLDREISNINIELEETESLTTILPKGLRH